MHQDDMLIIKISTALHLAFFFKIMETKKLMCSCIRTLDKELTLLTDESVSYVCIHTCYVSIFFAVYRLLRIKFEHLFIKYIL